jgi:hypothetical protein
MPRTKDNKPTTPHHPTPAERDERVSLDPLTPEEALKALLSTPPEDDKSDD